MDAKEILIDSLQTKIQSLQDKVKELDGELGILNIAFDSAVEVVNYKKQTISELQSALTESKLREERLREASIELFNMVHDSDNIQNKIKANDLYDIICNNP